MVIAMALETGTKNNSAGGGLLGGKVGEAPPASSQGSVLLPSIPGSKAIGSQPISTEPRENGLPVSNTSASAAADAELDPLIRNQTVAAQATSAITEAHAQSAADPGEGGKQAPQSPAALRPGEKLVPTSNATSPQVAVRPPQRPKSRGSSRPSASHRKTSAAESPRENSAPVQVSWMHHLVHASFTVCVQVKLEGLGDGDLVGGAMGCFTQTKERYNDRPTYVHAVCGSEPTFLILWPSDDSMG